MFSCFLLLTAIFIGTARGADQHTTRQIDALTERVGNVYWLKAVNGELPLFLRAAAPSAASLAVADGQSFEIIDLAGLTELTPYYRVRIESGEEGFIRLDSFHDEFNRSILTLDPYADKKAKAEVAAKEEKERQEWIEAQPWPATVKQAALKRQPIIGLTALEVRKILGAPNRIVKGRAQLTVAIERWHYRDGTSLTFHNGILNKVERAGKN